MKSLPNNPLHDIWVRVEELYLELGWSGMSDDETDDDAGATVNPPATDAHLFELPAKAVQRRKIPWLNEQISLIFYAVDTYAALLPLHSLRGNKRYTR
jgi:hypothetical protein